MSLDIFRQKAFKTTTLTDHINRLPHAPNRLGSMNVFQVKNVQNRTIWVTMKDGRLTLIPISALGAPISQNVKDLREAEAFQTYRVAKGDRVTAEEVQDLVAPGTENTLQTVAGEVSERLTGIREDMELTREHMRLGAINGLMVDADGSTVVDFFQKFGVTRPDEIDFDLDNATLSSLADKSLEVTKLMYYASKGTWKSSQTRVSNLCGHIFWRKLITNPEVIDFYKQSTNGAALDRNVQSFTMHGITHELYWGTEDDSTVAIPADKSRFVPLNTNGAFQEIYAPAEFAPFVNKKGKREYAMVIPDKDRQAYVDVELYMYPLFMCTRPEMLQTGSA